MDKQTCSKVSAVWAIAQGVSLALFPRLTVAVITRMLGTNFENADELQPKPAYLRQLRSLGVGLVAAGGTRLLLEGSSGSDTADTDANDQATDAGADDT
jgi:hypothetical protein